MSLKSEWKKFETRVREWWHGFVEQHIVAPDPYDGEGASIDLGGGVGPASKGLPTPSRASCWEGSNAQTRHMNVLSPKFTDEKVADRFQWAVERGCNTVHLFVANQGDGEGSGYTIYGGAPALGKPDKATVEMMARRLRVARGKGLSVVLWLMADDSAKWNATLLAAPDRYVADLKRSGLLDLADCVVLGLELDEYAKKAKVEKLAAALRGVWSGPVGTHHTTGKATFAGYGDILFWQTKPGLSAAQVKAEVQKAAKHGKPVVAFELARNPQRGLCEAALAAGAVGVGNW